MAVISGRKCNDRVVANAQDYSSHHNMGKTTIFLGFSLIQPIAWTHICRAGRTTTGSRVPTPLSRRPACSACVCPGLSHQLPLLHLQHLSPNGTTATTQQTELWCKWHCRLLLPRSTLSPPKRAPEQPRDICSHTGHGLL